VRLSKNSSIARISENRKKKLTFCSGGWRGRKSRACSPSLFLDGAGEQEPAGDRRLPRSTRFRPGQSGNPRGRPKGARGLCGLVASALGERVEAKENGRRRQITKLEAAVKQLVNRAASGDQRAAQFVFALLGEGRERSPPVAADTDSDALVIAELVRRLSRPPE
jgi:hypothetical protein